MKFINALRGEIGRHKGLKILAIYGVPVRVWPRTPFKMKKIQIISDNHVSKYYITIFYEIFNICFQAKI